MCFICVPWKTSIYVVQMCFWFKCVSGRLYIGCTKTNIESTLIHRELVDAEHTAQRATIHCNTSPFGADNCGVLQCVAISECYASSVAKARSVVVLHRGCSE